MLYAKIDSLLCPTAASINDLIGKKAKFMHTYTEISYYPLSQAYAFHHSGVNKLAKNSGPRPIN
jgi:hypothetical protein